MAMQSPASACDPAAKAAAPIPIAEPVLERPVRPTRDTYRKVLDSRKRRVRGLWQRNGRYFANLTVTDDLGRKSARMVPLKSGTLDDAKADYARLLTERDDERLRPIGQTPLLSDYIDKSYLPALQASATNGAKRESSVAKESRYLKRWTTEIGHLRLNKIGAHHLSTVLTKLAQEEYGSRSINLFLIAIRGVLKAAGRDRHIKPPLPFEGLEWQRVTTRSRSLVTAAEIDRLCEVALRASKFGRQFVDFTRFLQFSGARQKEALSIRWQDVDFDQAQVTIGAEGQSKNRKPRIVDFNPNLEAHLRDMQGRRQPDSKWLFPSPQRGDKDIHSETFYESLHLTRDAGGVVCQDCGKTTVAPEREKSAAPTQSRCEHCGSDRGEPKDRLLPAKLQKIGFHDLRHHFISYAVMSGIDFMTIARWVGHQDGGVLIGKVYGHLADDHRKRMAAQMSFGPNTIRLPQTSAM